MAAAGALNIELDTIQLSFAVDPASAEQTLLLRADVEIVDSSKVFKWAKNGKTIVGSGMLTSFRQVVEATQEPAEAATETKSTEAGAKQFTYTVGLQNFTILTEYIDLNEEVVSALAGVVVKVKISKSSSTDAEVPAGPFYAELSLSVAELMMGKGCSLGGIEPLTGANATCGEGVLAATSTIAWRFFADNNLAEFCLGCKVLQWPSASLVCPPGTWGLTYNDIIDPKAKVQPTPADLRTRYLEAIPKLIAQQATLAEYAVVIGNQAEDTASLLPPIKLKGVVHWNADMAGATSLDENIRSLGKLWSVHWTGVGGVFLSRNRVRSLAVALSSGGASAIPVLITKTPLNNGVAEGETLSCVGSIDIAALGQAGIASTTSTCIVNGTDFGEDSLFTVNATVSSPLVEEVPDFQPTQSSGSPKGRTLRVTPNNNRDAIAELKDQISAAIRTIATEYLVLFPSEDPSDEVGGKSHKSFDDRKVEFLHYLSTSGVYHAMKESLKPKIQRVVRSQFSARGQALSNGMTEIQMTDSLLSEIYVFLVKQCNHVLNGLFHSTLVDIDEKELSKGATIDDESESPVQLLIKLLSQAVDAEADGRVVDSEQRHLERLHVLSNNASLNESERVHEVHFELGKFYLRQAAKASQSSGACASWGDSVGVDSHRGFANYNASRAREALLVAVEASPTSWSTRQLLACLYHEAGQLEEAATAFQVAIDTQLNDGKGSGMLSFADFSGYESDRLCPVDPITYGTLATHFSLSGQALRARKALRLAVASYEKLGMTPAVQQHGLPRRTYVLVLSQVALYCSSHGFVSLALEASKMAAQCEASADAVATAKGRASATAPFIRHILKRSGAITGLLGNNVGSLEQSLILAEECTQCSDDVADVVNGLLASATVATSANDTNVAADTLASAISKATSAASPQLISLESFLQCAKLLLYAGRVDAALSVAITGQQVYTSASLSLVAAICFIRSDRLSEAEIALRDANILDNRNAEVWAYQCLVCLGVGYHRLKEAEAALNQALRLGISASPILRELGTAFISVDKLQTAEDLIRRALAAEGGKGSPYTRKLLGDVLAGQQQAARAIEEYQVILGDATNENVDTDLKIQTAEKCKALLITLGRREEIEPIDQIIASLRQQQF